jgi:hypothetical protein
MCALPTHAHVTLDQTVDQHGPGDAHDEGEALHPGPCGVVVGTSGPSPAAAGAFAARLSVAWAAVVEDEPGPIANDSPGESPPLFLLHASLLI